MAKPPIVEGSTATNQTTGERIIFRGGKWVPFDNQSRPPDTPYAEATPGSETRTRIALGFGPAARSQTVMQAEEQQGSPAPRNPYNVEWGASLLEGIPWDNGAIPAVVGGDTYQRYRQAAKTFESAFLPIFSGANVTDSEAMRQVRANLPALGDSPEILDRKARNRAQMLNAAADLVGRPRPFAEVGTWDFAGGSSPSAPAPSAPASPDRSTPAPAGPATTGPQRTGDQYTERGQRGSFVRYADMTPAQAATARRTSRNPGQYGTATRPFVARNETDYARLPAGAYYIFTDGTVQRKPGGN